MEIARVGLLFESEPLEQRLQYGLNVFQRYAEEILAHAGIPFTVIDSQERLSEFQIVIAGVTRDDADTAESLWRFAENGGVLISYRGLNKLAQKLGCVREQASGVGYADLAGPFGIPAKVRYLQAEVWQPGGQAESGAAVRSFGQLRAGKPDGEPIGPALLSFRVGKGSIHRWAVDIPSTVVAFQQGISPVLDDGVPAKDGTGAIDDDILKADDRCEMDWELDRTATETGERYYAHPYADYWREAMVGHLLRTAVEHGWTLPFIDMWPDGVENVALISLDSDMNLDEAAVTTLEVFREYNVPTTWCIIEPGFSEAVYAQAKREGHELALHYNALPQDGGTWDSGEFARQFAYVKDAARLDHVASNKNHYTRLEGWGELFRWCEEHGIEADQTRGPSKKGNIGFLFGTCHPYRPIAWFDEKNRFYDVLEIGFLTQDLNHPTLADDSVVVPFLEQVRKVRGVAHFLFHHHHIHTKPPVREAVRKVIQEAKKRGFQFWTSRQINDWERSRRKLKFVRVSGDGRVEVKADGLIRDTVVWIPAAAAVAGGATEMRYGVPCLKQVVRATASGASEPAMAAE